MPFCTNCGARLTDGANFCVMCGTPVKNVVPVPSPVAAQPKQNLKQIHLRVHGTSYLEENIKSLLETTDDYSSNELKDMYDDYELIQLDHFIESPVTLVPDPDNEHDPNAVKVFINGVHVGFIGKTYCAACKRRLEAGKIKRISAEIIGGESAKIYPTETGARMVERFYKAPYIMLDYWYED